MHEHRFQGQLLEHDHAGGEEPHGYFGHAEDWPQIPAAAAAATEAERPDRDRD